jgi:hypothetical protein
MRQRRKEAAGPSPNRWICEGGGRRVQPIQQCAQNSMHQSSVGERDRENSSKVRARTPFAGLSVHCAE